MLSSVSLRPCRCVGCSRSALPGAPNYPYCSGQCAARAANLASDAVKVLPVRAGEVITHECRGGGFVTKPAPYEGLLISKGDGSPILVPRPTIEAALDLLDGRSRRSNGNGRKYRPAPAPAETASQEAHAMSNDPDQPEEAKKEEPGPPAQDAPVEETEQPNDGSDGEDD